MADESDQTGANRPAARMAGGGKRLVYDGPHLQALVRQGSSPFLLVTFNARGSVANGQAIWGDPLLKKLDLNAVGFVTRQPNWFPGEDLAAAIDAVAPFVEQFQERIGYGYSQGGYAAIRASVPLGLTAAVALSPQWSIDPDDIVDARYNKYFDAAANKGMALTAAHAPARLMIVVDTKFEDDVRHLSRITAAIGSAQVVPLPFSDHDTVLALKGTETFAALLDAVRACAPLGPALAPARRASPIRREVMVKRALRRGQGERAFRLLAGLSLDRTEKTRMLIRFARYGAGAWVVDVAEQHATDEPENDLARAAYACVLASAGMRGRARRAATRAEELSSDSRVLALAKAAQLLALSSSDHNTVRAQKGTETFAALLDAVRDGAPLGPALASARRASPTRREEIVERALRRGQGERAFRLLAGLSLDRTEKTRMLIRFARYGAGAWVVDMAERHATDEPDNDLARAAYACVLASAGMRGRARRAAARAEELSSDSRVLALAKAAQVIALPSPDHDTARAMKRTETFAALLDAVRDRVPLGPALASARRANPTRREELVERALRRGQGERAARLFAGLALDSKAKSRTLARFARYGAGEQVVDAAEQHIWDEPDSALARAAYACVLASAGMRGRARRAAAHAEEMSGGDRILALTRAARTGVWDAEDDEDE